MLGMSLKDVLRITHAIVIPMVIKCASCGSDQFVEQKIGPIEDRSGKDMVSYDHGSSHILQVRYEYVCYKCGHKLELPRA